MMKALARFLLSVELLFSHPGKWWGERSWLLKSLLFLSIISIINGGTLWVYQKWNVRPADQTVQLNNQASQEITALRQQIAELKRQQQDLKEGLAGQTVSAAETVAAADSQIPPAIGGLTTEQLPDEASDDQATESARIVFLPAGKGETTPLYKQPEAKSAVVTTIPTDTWYLIVNKRDGWYQIEVDEDGRIGWIPASVAIEQGLE